MGSKIHKLTIFASILLSLFIIPFVSAGLSADNLTIISPTASSTISGTVTLNVSIDSVIPTDNYNNSIWYAGSSLTDNSTWVQIATDGNDTSSVVFNTTFDSTILEDANDYQINVTITNGTDTASKVVSSIIVDNFAPNQPTSVSPTGTQTNRTLSFVSTVADANTTSCTLHFSGTNPGAAQYTMTYSGSSCTHSLTSVPEGTYKYFVRASDETDTTDSVLQTVTIDITTSAGNAAKYIAEGKAVSGGGAVFSVVGNFMDASLFGIPLLVVVIIAIALIIIFAMRNR